MTTPPRPPRKRDSFLATVLARFLIVGDRLRPLLLPLLIGGVVLGGLLLLGIIPRIRRGRKLAAESRAEAKRLPSVSITRAELSAEGVALSLPGNVQPVEETQLSARTAGYVRHYYADIGDKVRAGQVLADIETPDIDQQAQGAGAELARSQAALAQSGAQLAGQGAALQTARANAARAVADLAKSRQNSEQQRAQLQQARANAELARVTWTRWQSLVAGGAISQQEADEKHAAYNSSLANVASLEAALRAGGADVQAFGAALNAAQANVGAAGQNVEAYRAAVNASRAGVSASQSNVARFNVLAGFRQVRAPYAGVITARNVDEGALIGASGVASAGDAGATSSANSSTSLAPSSSSGSARGSGGLFTLARLDSLRIYIDVPQNEAESVRPGLLATISVRELPGQHFMGNVVRTANALDPSTRTLRAEISLPNQSGKLLPGMFARVSMKVPRAHPAVLVPAGALIADARGNRIAVVQKERIAFRNVEIGRDFGESLEITNGLKPGENVVTNPTDDLHDGTRVEATVAEPVKDPSAGGAPKPTGAKKGGRGKAKGDDKSLNTKAKKLSASEGDESNEPEAQPGGADRAARQKQKGG